MDKKEYKYDAFISYRHCDLDKFVAENLHKVLESYDLPKNVKQKLGITGKTIKRVFRDQDELPLSSNLEDPIIDALNNSKYLIVICSPRLKESLWCKKEIETFKKIRGRENIFCVLIEGEPADSFPDEVLHDKGKLIEPLAADVRGTNKKEVLKKIKEEVLRLVAPMYSLDYDDLKQRHRQRKIRRIINTLAIALIASILFILYSSFMLIKISTQQKTLKLHQALTLSESSTKSLANDSRYDAIKSSYEALTRFNGVKMPYTSEAEYALSEALGIYDSGNAFKAISELKTDGIVDYIKDSKTAKYALVYDESEVLSLWDTKTLKKIGTYDDIPSFTVDDYAFTFSGDDTFAYITKGGNIKVLSTKDGKVLKEIKKEDDGFISIKGSSDGKYIVFITKNILFKYDVKENKVTGKYTTNEFFNDQLYFSDDYKYVFAITEESYFKIDNDTVTVRVIDLDTLTEKNTLKVDAGYSSGLVSRNNNAYMLFNSSTGTDYTLVAISYNYIDNKVNWTYKDNDIWGKYIYKSLPEGSTHIMIVHNNKLEVLDQDSGNIVARFDTKSEIIDVFGFTDEEIYLTFNTDGTVNYMKMADQSNMNYNSKFSFNVGKYSKVAQSEKGFLMVPYNENRVIVYENNTNNRLKEVETDIKEKKSSVIYSASELKKLKEEYDVQNKSLVSKMLYSDKKDLLFVLYTTNDMAIYNTKTKELLNTVDNIHDIETYYGKDKYGRVYVGDISFAYIIDSNYNKVGRVSKPYAVKDDKIYIKTNNKIYSINVYTLKDLLKEAKEYLK